MIIQSIKDEQRRKKSRQFHLEELVTQRK